MARLRLPWSGDQLVVNSGHSCQYRGSIVSRDGADSSLSRTRHDSSLKAQAWPQQCALGVYHVAPGQCRPGYVSYRGSRLDLPGLLDYSILVLFQCGRRDLDPTLRAWLCLPAEAWTRYLRHSCPGIYYTAAWQSISADSRRIRTVLNLERSSLNPRPGLDS